MTLDRIALANDPAICDLRSDTVTRPDAAMREAMAAAPVGDDVYGDDPSVTELETFAASMLGKAEAVFFPTGTQSNLAAMLSHCGRGDELITGTEYHVKASEGAGASVLGGIAIHTIETQPDGSLAADAISAAIKPDDAHQPVSRLLCLENTHKGAAISLAATEAASAAARERGLAVHLDGARLFNACQALDVTPTALAATADTVSVCLSKGLGAPAGTLLLGPGDVLKRARRWRKVLGGGMRQSGILAAAGLYALRHNVERLGDDHRRAAVLAQHLTDIGAGDPARPPRTATSMVFFTPGDDHMAFRAAMAGEGVLLGGNAPTIRIVLHKDIDDDKLDRVCSAFSQVCRG